MKRFKKNKKVRNTLLTLGTLVILGGGGIILSRSYALYQEKKEFNVLKGRIGNFSKSNSDIELAIFLDEERVENIPEKGLYTVNVTCDKGTGTWDYEEWAAIIKNFKYGTKCNVKFTTDQSFSNYLIAKYKTEDSLVEVTHEQTDQTGTNAIIDYRYTGSEANNYVYFGCEENCTEDNLYRIIGVIPTQNEINGVYENRVKLIKTKYYTETESGYLKQSSGNYLAPGGKGYNWNSVNSTKWEESSLNKKVLNEIYYNGLSEYQKYIEPSVWYLGAVTTSNYSTYTSEDFYKLERGSVKGYSGGSLSTVANIGLLYPSDFGISLGKRYQYQIFSSNISQYKTSWLHKLASNEYEWTITPTPDQRITAWDMQYTGVMGATYVSSSTNFFGIRPTFYLKADVLYKSGDGSIFSPYRIAV